MTKRKKGYRDPEMLKVECARIKSQILEEPRNAQLWQDLGKVYTEWRMPSKAKWAYECSLVLDDLDPWSHLYLSNYYYGEKDYESALREAHRVQCLAPHLVMGYVCAADAYIRMRKYGKAEAEYKKGNAVTPGERVLQSNWAKMRKFLERRRYRKAHQLKAE